jgi:hypothetical protein
MSIRIKTLKDLSTCRKQIARVRWRAWTQSGDGSGALVDEDGKDSDPLTWSRWEEEFFVRVDLARVAVQKDTHKDIRPRGVIDRVEAREVWRALADEDRDIYEQGNFRVLYARVGVPRRLLCDEVDHEQ